MDALEPRSDLWKEQLRGLGARNPDAELTVMLALEGMQGIIGDSLVPMMQAWFDELVPQVHDLAGGLIRIEQQQIGLATRLDQLAVQLGAQGYEQRRTAATVDDLLRWREATLARLATIEQQLDALREAQP